MGASFSISNHALRNGGGMERYTLTLVDELHARGLRPTVVARSFDTTLPEYGWVDAVRVGTAALPSKLRDHWFDWRLRRMKRRGELFPLLACNPTGAADIAICGGTHLGYLAAGGRAPGRSDRWKVGLEREHYGQAAVVVAHSQRMVDELQSHYGIDPGKLHLLYPPVDTVRFAPAAPQERQRLRRELGLPDDQLVILLASTGHKRKGLALLHEFVHASAAPLLLVVAGRPVDVAGPRLRYLGYRSDLEQVYRAVDVTAMASSYEPFGLVSVESVLCGTPVLQASNAGCAEVIGAPAALPFELADPGSLGRAVDAAVRRWRAGSLRLADPRAGLRYDPAVAPHVDALLKLADALRQRRGRGARA